MTTTLLFLIATGLVLASADHSINIDINQLLLDISHKINDSSVTWLDFGVVCCILDIDPERPSIMFLNSDRNETESFYNGLFRMATGKVEPINENAHSQTEWMIRILKRYKSVGHGVTIFISTLLQKAHAHCGLIDHDGTNLLKEMFLFGEDPNGEMLEPLMEIISELSADEIDKFGIDRTIINYLQQLNDMNVKKETLYCPVLLNLICESEEGFGIWAKIESSSYGDCPLPNVFIPQWLKIRRQWPDRQSHDVVFCLYANSLLLSMTNQPDDDWFDINYLEMDADERVHILRLMATKALGGRSVIGLDPNQTDLDLIQGLLKRAAGSGRSTVDYLPYIVGGQSGLFLRLAAQLALAVPDQPLLETIKAVNSAFGMESWTPILRGNWGNRSSLLALGLICNRAWSKQVIVTVEFRRLKAFIHALLQLSPPLVQQLTFCELPPELIPVWFSPQLAVNAFEGIRSFFLKKAPECSICIRDFTLDDNRVKWPSCDHHFHPQCLFPWAETSQTCPNCRSEIEDEDQLFLLLQLNRIVHCRICKRDVSVSEEQISWPLCDHRFHRQCLAERVVVPDRCPGCDTQIKDDDQYEHLLQQMEELSSCFICNNSAHDPISMPGCGHKFHALCLLPSLVANKDCPKCHRRLNADDRKQWRDKVLRRLKEIIERAFGSNAAYFALYAEFYGPHSLIRRLS